MAEIMEYPKTPNEFIERYSFKDSEEIYTNGSKLIPVFRVEQMLEHYYKPLKEKATPKKPIYEDFEENEIGEMIPNIAKCPTCGCEFAFGKWNEIDSHHCICGQALDWSEKE